MMSKITIALLNVINQWSVVTYSKQDLLAGISDNDATISYITASKEPVAEAPVY